MKILFVTLLLFPLTLMAQKKVGINTTSPVHPFQVNVDSAFATIVLDQNNIGTLNTLLLTPGTNMGAQSLTVGVTGQLAKISITLGASDVDELLIEAYRGNGPGGTWIAAQTILDINSSGIFEVTFPQPWPSVTAGETINFIAFPVTGTSMTWRRNISNAYAGGQAHFFDGNAWSTLSYDLAFKTYVNSPDTLSVDVLSVQHDGKVRIKDYTLPADDGEVGEVIMTNGSGLLTWSNPDDLQVSQIRDTDNDTKVLVENTADEDIIRFNTAGSEKMNILSNGNVGISTNLPQAKLDVNGKIRIGDDLLSPQAGMIRWNATAQDFEGYNGITWISLSSKGITGDWGDVYVYPSSQSEIVNLYNLDFFGNSVYLSGDYSIVGIPYHNDINDRGKAEIFKRYGHNWLSQEALIASDAQNGALFGSSVGISEDYAIIGAKEHTVSGNYAQGQAYIFYRSGTDWNEQDILVGSDCNAYDKFGSSVSISGDLAIIGAPFHEVNGNNYQGQAYIFKRNGSVWTEEAILSATDGEASDYFGESVSISGNIAVVGAPQHNTNGNGNQGKAYVFIKTGSTWSLQTMLTASDGDSGDHFGTSVCVSDDYVIIGAPNKDIEGVANRGKAYIYMTNDTTWTQQAILQSVHGIRGEYFGQSVTITEGTAVIGSPGIYDYQEATTRGKAYLFVQQGSGWVQKVILSSFDGNVGDNFGRAVSISGNNIVVGAPFYDSVYSIEGGRAYYFQKN